MFGNGLRKDSIPKGKVIWEAFYGNGESGAILTNLSFNVTHEETDFFTNNEGDVIVSNPPFSKKKGIMTRLKEFKKPCSMICPSSMIKAQYIRSLFKDNRLQIIIPCKRISFLKKKSIAKFLTIGVIGVISIVFFIVGKWIYLLIPYGCKTNQFKLNCLIKIHMK